MLNELFKKLKKLVVLANTYGVPLPLVRDPKTDTGSVSLTLVFVSSVMVILGLISKEGGKLEIVNINHALEFFYASSFLYFGRTWRTHTAAAAQEKESNVPAVSTSKKLPPK